MRPIPGIVLLLLGVASTASAQTRTQVVFEEPSGMRVHWLTTVEGKSVYSKTPLEVPGRFNFVAGATYRLKLTHLPGHPGVELFPTLEVVAGNPRTREFLAHNAAAIRISAEEIDQVLRGNFITKVVYLPFAPREDAGSALLVLRIGNIIDPGAKH